jgi:aromatic ring-cleaving dioxygenase
MPNPASAAVQINGYHAHVYYSIETKPAAERLAEMIGNKLSVEFGGFGMGRLVRTRSQICRSFSPPRNSSGSCRG